VINDYYLKQVSDAVAATILNQLNKSVLSLQKLPERGSVPQELLNTGITRYRQIMCDRYRIIYRVKENSVYVMMVIDGRRDIATSLFRRLQVLGLID